jgi:hypothetical protein
VAGGRNPAALTADLSRHPPAGAGQRVGGGSLRRPAGIRLLWLRRPRRLSRLHRRQDLGARRRRGGAPGAAQSRFDSRPRRRDGRRARRRLARRHAARSGRPRASKATSTARRPRPSPA